MTTEEILERINAHEDPNLMETLDLKSRGVWECALQLSVIASKLPDSEAGSLAELRIDHLEERVAEAIDVLSEGSAVGPLTQIRTALTILRRQ